MSVTGSSLLCILYLYYAAMKRVQTFVHPGCVVEGNSQGHPLRNQAKNVIFTNLRMRIESTGCFWVKASRNNNYYGCWLCRAAVSRSMSYCRYASQEIYRANVMT